MSSFTLVVTDVLKPVTDVVLINFKQPRFKKIIYKSGQYITIVIRINGRKFLRPYSLSSSPSTDNFLQITIKRIPNGIVSNYLYDHVKGGDNFEVMEPMGNFVYDPSLVTTAKNIMLWGAGSGITPLMSIIKTALANSTDTKIHLFYCNRNPEYVIFQPELKDLQDKYREQLVIWNFYTGIPEDVYLNYQIAGRITEQKILSILSDTTNLAQAAHYICGPQGLKDTIKSVLSKFEVGRQNVFSEEFEVLIDPEQFDDIDTQTIQIHLNGASQQVEVTKGRSMLDAALDALLDLSYSCQTGTCMLCKAKLTNGQVKVIGVEKLPVEVAADECLLCCSYPLTNNVEVLIP